MSIFSAMIVLLLVMDPLGNLPAYLAVLRNIPKTRHKRIILREMTITFLILVLFLFLGKPLLSVMRLDQSSLNIAGGFILVLIALKMIFPRLIDIGGDVSIEGEPFIVPLAVPLTAGPSAIATVIVLMSSEASRWAEWLLAILSACLITMLILLLSGFLGRILGKRGMLAVTKLMGLLLVTIGIQMALSGLAQHFGLNT